MRKRQIKSINKLPTGKLPPPPAEKIPYSVDPLSIFPILGPLRIVISEGKPEEEEFFNAQPTVQNGKVLISVVVYKNHLSASEVKIYRGVSLMIISSLTYALHGGQTLEMEIKLSS
jgi:hypothetical protein